MPAPTFTIAFGIKQSIDHLGKGIGRGIVQKNLHFFGRGRQSDQVEKGPAYQYALARLRIRGKVRSLQSSEDKPIDIASRPALLLNRWSELLGNRLERPMFLAEFFPIVRLLEIRRSDQDLALEPRPRSSHLHPVLQDLHLGRIEWFLRRHRHILVAIANRLYYLTFLQFVWHECRTGLSTPQQSLEAG